MVSHVSKMTLLLYIAALMSVTMACGISAPMQLPSPSDAPAPSNPRMFVREFDTYTVTGDLYIRTCASYSCPALRDEVLHAGDNVICFEWSGVWCRHERGWSHSGWLK